MKNKKIIMVVLLLLISCIGIFVFAGCSWIGGRQDVPRLSSTISIDDLKDQSLSSVVAHNSSTAVVKVYCEWAGSKSAGAGFVMNENGYVVTNAHCILKENVTEFDKKSKVSIEFINSSIVQMEVVDYDANLDIAILRPKSGTTKYDFLPFGDSSKVVFGQQAYTFGNPENIALMFSSAMVSNPGIQLDSTDPKKSIILDSTINHGNSGGALLNDKTEVIGVVFARLESEDSSLNKLYGVGCAIPSNDVMAFIDKEVKIKDAKAVYTKAV